MRDALLGAGTSVWEWDVGSDRLSNIDASAALLGYAPGEIGTVAAGLGRTDPPRRPGCEPRGLPAPCPRRHADLRARVPRPCPATARGAGWPSAGRWSNATPTASRCAWSARCPTSRCAARRRARRSRWPSGCSKISRHVPGIVYQYRSRPGDLGRGYFPYVSDSVIDLLGVSPQALMEDAAALLPHGRARGPRKRWSRASSSPRQHDEAVATASSGSTGATRRRAG